MQDDDLRRIQPRRSNFKAKRTIKRQTLRYNPRHLFRGNQNLKQQTKNRSKYHYSINRKNKQK